MAYNEKTGNYITPVGRASFPVLVEPKAIGKQGKGEPKYQLTLLFKKGTGAQESQDFKDLEAAVEKAIQDKWGSNRPRKVKSPFLTIDDLRNKVPAGYEEGDVFIRLASTAPVGVVMKNPDGSVVRLESPADIKKHLYAGCDVKASVNVYAWVHEEGGSGVSFGLANVMKVGENEPFGSTNADAADDFGEPVSGGSADDFMG